MVEVVNHGGKQYVTVAEFAKRLNVTPQTVNTYIREGKIFAEDPLKKGQKLLAWKTQSDAFRVAQATKQTFANKRKGNRKKPIQDSPIIQSPNEVGSPNLGQPDILPVDNSIKDIEVNDNTIDLSRIDPYDHPDCWIMGVDGISIKAPDGRPALDYEKLKTKVTVQTYQVKLDVMQGNLIPKEELLVSIQGVGAILKSAVDTIAQKYAAPFIAKAESITGHEFTPQEHTEMMNIMRNVPKEIFPSIQQQLENMLNERTEETEESSNKQMDN